MGQPLRPREVVTSRATSVPGVPEILQAHFVEHVYPAHTHDLWTLLVVDTGTIRFDLGRHEHGALTSRVTLLPPHVAHTGRAGTAGGFDKRVLYLDGTVLGEQLVGRAVAEPGLADPLLATRVRQLHGALAHDVDPLEAESRLALVRRRLHHHLGSSLDPFPGDRAGSGLADRLRQLLDSRVVDGITLAEAGAVLGAHPDHLVRAFTRAHGLPPHRYLVGRRVDRARRLLLAGLPAAEVAAAAGFADQAHLTRHFGRLLGTTPARFARGAGPAPRHPT